MIVDWLSFTVPVQATEYEQALYERAIDGLRLANSPFAEFLLSLERKSAAARRPYGIAWKMEHNTLFTAVNCPHALVEVSGQRLADLRGQSLLDGLLASMKDRVTRVDIALDILGVTPDEIIEAGYSGKFRTHSRIKSDKGVTCYVGSQKSERYCRVYRYAPPHPRANLCRIEQVFKGDYATIITEAIINDGLTNAGLSGLESFQFKHERVPRSSGDVLATVSVVKSDQNTLRWLLVQVAPAFKRLVENGTIENPEEWLRENLIPERFK